MINQVSLENLKVQWEQAYEKSSLHVPFLTWKWHESWQKVLGKNLTPFYLSVDEAVVAPFARQGNTVTFSGGEEIADYLDLIGTDGAKEQAWTQIIDYCKKEHIASLSLRNVPQSSPTIEFFKKQANSVVQQEDTTPKVILPATWEEFVEGIPSRKYRHELERKVRKFEREHLDAQMRESANPGEDINILLELMEKDAAKKTFLTPGMKTMFQTIGSTFKDSISLLVLGMGDKHGAATLSFVTANAYYLYNSGFDKDCCRNAGFYLKAMSIKYAIEKGYKEYNFLQGSERYKYELGGKDFFVYQITYNI